ncbi:transposase [Streptomyces sp. NPDC088726]|uniref:transposase n=1 Tax=Streptomyces sp. NPDC088726 TaxID=3365874 RepID=UPI0038237514
MIRRHELSDGEWEFVRPLLPKSVRGRKRLDDPRVLNGIVWKFRTGTAWRIVPDRHGPWATLHTCFRRWAAGGTFDRMLRAVQAEADAAGGIEWLVSVDSTIVRAQPACGGGPSPDRTQVYPGRTRAVLHQARGRARRGGDVTAAG